jgi:3-deoxy-7-phosphoheptulonate synthase
MKFETIAQTDNPKTDRTPKSVPLPSPDQLRDAIPRTPGSERTVDRSRVEIERILMGEDDHRLLVVCGPCSIHDINASMDYARRLANLSKSVEDDIAIVMRTYFEKPRSVVGWKGLVYDPELAGASAPNNGLSIARRLLSQINEMGLPCATEFLNPVIAPYLEDLISYGAIGARTAESQIHRELVSSLSIPIGMKNDMQGNLQSAVNAIQSANQAHSIFGIDAQGAPAIIQAPGNPYAHVFLRGGHQGPNLDRRSTQSATKFLASSTLKRPIMLDCSHANSNKDYRNQGPNAFDATELFINGTSEIAGIMLESNLIEGSQRFQAGSNHTYGQSITDSCIGWNETELLVHKIARKLKSRRDR